MKDILTGEEYKKISEDLQNRQINLIMIERHTHDFDGYNHRLIIDEDLCEIQKINARITLLSTPSYYGRKFTGLSPFEV